MLYILKHISTAVWVKEQEQDCSQALQYLRDVVCAGRGNKSAGCCEFNMLIGILCVTSWGSWAGPVALLQSRLLTPFQLLRTACLHSPKSCSEISQDQHRGNSSMLKTLQQGGPEIQPSSPHPHTFFVHILVPCPKRQMKGTSSTSLSLFSWCVENQIFAQGKSKKAAGSLQIEKKLG